MEHAHPFPTDVAGLPLAGAPEIVDVPPRGAFDLTVHPVAKRIGDAVVRMLAYNGSIPGPTLRVRQGSEVAIRVRNDMDMETTVHWHGLRLRNEYDGVPYDTQAPIPPGGEYTNRLTFPDAGLFWYHPHMREDYAQELGLYGNVIVVPEDPAYWPPVDREVVLTLDDVLIQDGAIAPFDPDVANFAAMGRFGNVLLIGGETTQRVQAVRGEVVRFLLTNTANTRVFRVAATGARMKLVGGDGGRYEREEWVQDVVIAPSERAIVDVLVDGPGALEHVTPGRVHPLVRIEASGDGGAGSHVHELRVNADMAAERERIAAYLGAAPDKTLALVAEMETGEPAARYSCPMHPEIVSDEPGSCPRCGMKLMPAAVTAEGEHHGRDEHHGHDGMADGIEWEDLMFETNRATTTRNMRWKIVDRVSGKANGDIDWTFEEGDQVKIRIVNEMESDHPMHHPFHVHGERFLVLARDGVEEPNLVWKDTVLIRTGQIVDLLMDASNPGLWMAHCHIAEHMEAGMTFTFRVRALR